MSATTLTLRFADGSAAEGIVVDPLDPALEALFASDSGIAIRMDDDDDASGHGPSDTLTLWVAGQGDDVEGHALALRLPNGRLAEELRSKIMAGGVVATVVIAGAIAVQAAPDGIAMPDPVTQTESAQAVHPGATRQTLRTDALTPTVSAGAVHPGGDAERALRTDALTPTVSAGAVHPGGDAERALRTDALTPTVSAGPVHPTSESSLPEAGRSPQKAHAGHGVSVTDPSDAATDVDGATGARHGQSKGHSHTR